MLKLEGGQIAARSAIVLSSASLALCVVFLSAVYSKVGEIQARLALDADEFKSLSGEAWAELIAARSDGGRWKRATGWRRASSSKRYNPYRSNPRPSRPVWSQPARYTDYRRSFQESRQGTTESYWSGGNRGYQQTTQSYWQPKDDGYGNSGGQTYGGYPGDNRDLGVESGRGGGGGQCSCSRFNECPAGPPGDPGTEGVPGEAGRDGTPGERGRDGIAPPIIPLPDNRCRICPPGPLGPMGPSGRPGPDGRPGSRGDGGLAGKPGRKGPSGPPGRGGGSGRPGSGGRRGDSGTPGTRGSKGSPGNAGNPGRAGPKGPSGLPGRNGVSGPRGQTGRPGPDGQPGPSGRPAQPGPPGPQGPPGEDAQYCPCPGRQNPFPNRGVNSGGNGKSPGYSDLGSSGSSSGDQSYWKGDSDPSPSLPAGWSSGSAGGIWSPSARATTESYWSGSNRDRFVNANNNFATTTQSYWSSGSLFSQRAKQQSYWSRRKAKTAKTS